MAAFFTASFSSSLSNGMDVSGFFIFTSIINLSEKAAPGKKTFFAEY